MGQHTDNGAKIVIGLVVVVTAGLFWYGIKPVPDQVTTTGSQGGAQLANNQAQQSAVQSIRVASPDQTNNEPLPDTTPPPRLMRTGLFVKAAAASAQGKALIYRMPGGSHLLRLESLNVTSGNGLRVYLSSLNGELRFAPSKHFMSVAELSANTGSQNYLLPDGIEPERWRNVVIASPVDKQIWASAALD